MLKIYTYEKCDTCRKALKWLAQRGVKPVVVAIRETPPSVHELKTMLKAQLKLKNLFNTSGLDYKALGLKNQLDQLSEREALNLLATNGNLVKRPFFIGKEVALVGFNTVAWEQTLAALYY